MLVLMRRRNDSILIGDDIEITLLEINGSQVKIGIEAPKEIPIIRKEISHKYKKENTKIDVEGDK